MNDRGLVQGLLIAAIVALALGAAVTWAQFRRYGAPGQGPATAAPAETPAPETEAPPEAEGAAETEEAAAPAEGE